MDQFCRLHWRNAIIYPQTKAHFRTDLTTKNYNMSSACANDRCLIPTRPIFTDRWPARLHDVQNDLNGFLRLRFRQFRIQVHEITCYFTSGTKKLVLKAMNTSGMQKYCPPSYGDSTKGRWTVASLLSLSEFLSSEIFLYLVFAYFGMVLCVSCRHSAMPLNWASKQTSFLCRQSLNNMLSQTCNSSVRWRKYLELCTTTYEKSFERWSKRRWNNYPHEIDVVTVQNVLQLPPLSMVCDDWNLVCYQALVLQCFSCAIDFRMIQN